MSRVEWTRMSGDEVEDVIAIMLLREHRRGHHIRPSQGDHGIDVIIPEANPAVATVYQVKKFASNLTSGQKTQILDSINRLTLWIEESGVTVETLYITLPLNPTPENREWLTAETASVPFAVEWYGLSQIEGLVSDHKKVIDYYLHGGRAQLDNSIRELTQVLRTTLQINGASETSPLTASEVSDHFASVRSTINEYDPFYEYDFSVSGTEPSYPDNPKNNIVSVFIEQTAHDAWVMVTIRSQFDDAESWRAATLQVKAMPSTEESRAGVEDFVEYGLPATFDAEFSIDLPGGLGAESATGIVHVGPAITGDAPPLRRLRWQTVDEGNAVLEEVLMDTSEATRGIRQDAGVAVTSSETSGVFTSVWRYSIRENMLRIGVEMHSLAGKSAADIQRATSFLRSFGAPNKLRLSPQYGPVADALQPLDHEPLSNWRSIANVVDDLVTLQQTTNDPVLFPDLDELTPEKQGEIRRYARLIRGEVIEGTWGNGNTSIDLRDGLDAPAVGHVFAVRYVQDLRLELCRQTIFVGRATIELPFATRSPAIRQNADGSRTLQLKPIAENNKMQMAIGAPSDVSNMQVFIRRIGSLISPPSEAGEGAVE